MSQSNKYSEDELVLLLRQKDQQAFAYLYDNYAPALNGVIYRMVEEKQLAEDMIIATTPIREKINAIANDAPYLRQVARHGAIKARESASKTIKEVREIIGFRSF